MEKKYTLPKEFADKWVEALRSGEYKQTKDRLKSKGECRYCCLGVAAIIQGYDKMEILENNGELCEINIPLDDYGDDYEYTLNEHYGVPMSLISGELPNELINLNDNEDKSFPEIADWITANVEFI